MPQGRRTRVLQGLRNKQLKVLVATDVAARGIDVPSISHVINYGLPMKAEDYVHRIGRTGRAGRNGLAVTLAERMDSGMIRRIQQFTTQNIPVATIVGLEPKSPEPRMFAPRADNKFGGGGKSFGHGRPSGPGKSFGNKPFGKPAYQRAGEGFPPRDRAPFDRDRAPIDRDSAQHNRFSTDRPNDRHNSVFIPNGQPAQRGAFDRAPVDRNANGFAPRKPAGAPAKGGFSKPQRPRPGGFSR
jgi:superfamily II DNA/RNA helicase